MKIDKPIEYYKELQAKFKENANKYFDNLVEESGIDLEENYSLANEYNNSNKTLDDCEKKYQSIKNTLKAMNYILIIMCSTIVILLMTFEFIDYVNEPVYDYRTSTELSTTTNIIILSSLLVATIILYCIGRTICNKKIKELRIDVEFAREDNDDIANEAWSNAWNLNQLLTDKTFKEILNETTDEIKLDNCHTAKRFYFLEDFTKYVLYSAEENSAYTSVISGSIADNPFGIIQSKIKYMYDEIYTGSITISWQVQTRDAQGNIRTVTKTQVLTASIKRPAPAYTTDCYVEYYNPACNNLRFKREPLNIKIKNEKALAKLGKAKEKELNKKAELALEQGKNFMPLADTEFEAVFNALNRNNEREFRMMFTPLAIQNIKSLFINSPYGDDFYFLKIKDQNIISPLHSCNIDYNFSPSYFYSYDVCETRKKFLERNLKLLQSIYFALAPIASIPIYLQTKVNQYDVEVKSNVSPYEQEVIANSFDLYVISELSDTDVVVKVKEVNIRDTVDIVSFYVYGFRKVPQTTYITRFGGDGLPHDVPVHYYDYYKTAETVEIEMMEVDISYIKYVNSKYFTDKTIIYKDSILACIYNGTSRINSIIQEILKGE